MCRIVVNNCGFLQSDTNTWYLLRNKFSRIWIAKSLCLDISRLNIECSREIRFSYCWPIPFRVILPEKDHQIQWGTLFKSVPKSKLMSRIRTKACFPTTIAMIVAWKIDLSDRVTPPPPPSHLFAEQRGRGEERRGISKFVRGSFDSLPSMTSNPVLKIVTHFDIPLLDRKMSRKTRTWQLGNASLAKTSKARFLRLTNGFWGDVVGRTLFTFWSIRSS